MSSLLFFCVRRNSIINWISGREKTRKNSNVFFQFRSFIDTHYTKIHFWLAWRRAVEKCIYKIEFFWYVCIFRRYNFFPFFSFILCVNRHRRRRRCCSRSLLLFLLLLHFIVCATWYAFSESANNTGLLFSMYKCVVYRVVVYQVFFIKILSVTLSLSPALLCTSRTHTATHWFFSSSSLCLPAPSL